METLALKKRIKVEVVSDVACPWCYIGKKRLEKALELTKGQFDFDITYKPYQLDARIPAQGVDYKQHLQNKFGLNRLEEAWQRVESIGQSVGIDFQFHQMKKAINTLPLHVLLNEAGKEGFQQALAEALFKANFEKPVDLSDETVLVELMARFGWSKEKTTAVLHDEALRISVVHEINHYQQLGISGVPFFIVNDKYGISGAQATETFVSAFNSLKPEDFLAEEAPSCSVDGEC